LETGNLPNSRCELGRDNHHPGRYGQDGVEKDDHVGGHDTARRSGPLGCHLMLMTNIMMIIAIAMTAVRTTALDSDDSSSVDVSLVEGSKDEEGVELEALGDEAEDDPGTENGLMVISSY